jgi:hypothetical protein
MLISVTFFGDHNTPHFGSHCGATSLFICESWLGVCDMDTHVVALRVWFFTYLDSGGPWNWRWMMGLVEYVGMCAIGAWLGSCAIHGVGTKYWPLSTWLGRAVECCCGGAHAPERWALTPAVATAPRIKLAPLY